MTGDQSLELPPGFRFHPTDEELVMHYLCRKCASQTISVPIIAEIDLYKFDPWQLPGNYRFFTRFISFVDFYYHVFRIVWFCFQNRLWVRILTIVFSSMIFIRIWTFSFESCDSVSETDLSSIFDLIKVFLWFYIKFNRLLFQISSVFIQTRRKNYEIPRFCFRNWLRSNFDSSVSSSSK